MKSSACVASLVLVLFAAAPACQHPLPGTQVLKPQEGDPYLLPVGGGGARLRPEICRNIAENKPEERRLDEGALITFLERQGYRTSVERARPDLVYVDVLSGDEGAVRLRVAILPDPQAAGQNLHRALLEHGAGAWGVHRSNLAVLAPVSSPRHAVTFAGRTKLACWGVLTIADRDDDFVLPGGYMEL